jgi:hypothetical protein
VALLGHPQVIDNNNFLRSLTMLVTFERNPVNVPTSEEYNRQMAETARRLEEMSCDDIDFSDIPETDETFFREARLVYPKSYTKSYTKR